MTHPRLATLAVLAGLAAGCAVAAVQASGDDPAPRARVVKLAAAPPPASVAITGRLRDGRYDPSYTHLRVHRATLRETARLKDPAGGPDWVLRSFDAERVTLQRPARSLRAARVVGRNRCVQLGREKDGRFGWIYGDGRFRVTPLGVEGEFSQCGSRRRPGLLRETSEILDLSDFAAPRAAYEILWGEAPLTKRLELTGTRGADGELPRRARGAFLVVTGKGSGLARGTLLLDGRRVAVLPTAGRAAVKPGSERVEARTPDLAGGPPRGVLAAELEDGRPCLAGAGQIVEDRLGGVDTRLGRFSAAGTSSCQPFRDDLPDEFACDISTGFGSDTYGGDDPLVRRARVERRLLPGRLTVTAMCRESVERVTLRTPRDIRTLRPSPLAHVIFAIYDGDFPAGELEFTAHYAGGRTWKQRFPLGF